MSCPKKQKQAENEQEMDYISSLPDTLLCHILSFVPTKSAVATSILSRRWVSLWTKVPVLDFIEIPRIIVERRESEMKKFSSFINKVLLHNDIHHLQRVQFEVFRGSDSFWLKVLNNSILKREIRELNLYKLWAGPNNIMHLPTALFSRERLVVLKVKGSFKISLPLSLHLPSLETLVLRSLYIEGQDTLKIVPPGCSALKELVIEWCHGLRKLYVESLTLERLRIEHTREEKVVVKGPNVRILDLDCFGAEYDFSDLSSLVEARVDVYADEATKLPPALQLIRRFSHVRTLQLSQSAVEVFGRVSENELPMFPNLTLLDIEIAHNMFQMLKYAPRITRLVVNVGRSIDNTRTFPSDIVPQCVLSLPVIEIRNFGGFEDDSALVKYIFKNATVLKELKIHMHRASVKRERDAYKKLLCFPRLSPCEVVICSSCGDDSQKNYEY